MTIGKLLYGKPLQGSKDSFFSSVHFIYSTKLKKYILIPLQRVKHFSYIFVKKYPRVINYSKFLLIAVCLLCIAAAYTELATVKQTAQPEFVHRYCSYNFHHNYAGCLRYMNGLSWRYFYDALRFISVPTVVFIIWLARGTKHKS